ncbi:hypothetical protein HHK36_028302 [Tetracentron sinense]|uniref:F-box/kelch-repeat protein SKIP25 n=1 Tax=Tetracentron sinense TaxID=13715 RepID=A0A834YFJ8_TETSI|nr:hypothetical protein HHK36_028302 [Tetracentron sinense]
MTATNGSDTDGAATKRRKQDHEYQPLLPGLPDHIAQLCLSLLHPSLLFPVSRSWRRLIYSPSFPPFLSLYALLSSSSSNPTSQIFPHQNQNQNQIQSSNSIQFHSFDPISSKWDLLPPPPLNLLLRHPSFISRNLPIQSVTVSGHLVLLAATTHHFLPALSRPLIFNPLSNTWSFGPPISAPRRWCAAGSARGAVYVGSGVGSHYSRDVARSAERWDLKRDCLGWRWEKTAGPKDGRFSREAVEAVGWRGKLCMVNVKGDAVKEGLVYDVERDLWEEMPKGMLIGWKGAAAAMDEDVIFVVDEGKGVLRQYNPEMDCWEELLQSEELKGAEQIVAGGGRVCAVCAEGRGIAVVDVVARPARLWVVDPPPALQAVAVHILPRISRPES